MDQSWLTMNDWPVRAFDGKPARKAAVSTMSATVVELPSAVSFSMTVQTISPWDAEIARPLRDLLLDNRRGNEVGADHVGADAMGSPSPGAFPAPLAARIRRI